MLIKTFDSEDVYDILDDIQRVEKNCLYLKKRILALCGIDLTLNIKEDWIREDIPTIEEMERIRGNCEKIIRVLDDKSLIPDFNDTFSYIQANSLENALKSTDEKLQRLITLIDRPRAGFYFASEPLVLIAGRSDEMEQTNHGMTKYTKNEDYLHTDHFNSMVDNIENLYDSDQEIVEKIKDYKELFDNHVANKQNPHEVTAEQIGLGNVDNTADIDKPVSNAQQTAIQDVGNESKNYTDQCMAPLNAHVKDTTIHHSHSNKAVLDTITKDMIDNMNNGNADLKTLKTSIPFQSYGNIYFPVNRGLVCATSTNMYGNLQGSTSVLCPYPILWLEESIESQPDNDSDIVMYESKIVDVTNAHQPFPTLIAGYPIYVKGTLGMNSSRFMPEYSDYIICGNPTNTDQYTYMLLGFAITDTTFYFQSEHPMYQFINNMFQPVDRANGQIGYEQFMWFPSFDAIKQNTDEYKDIYPYYIEYISYNMNNYSDIKYWVSVVYPPELLTQNCMAPVANISALDSTLGNGAVLKLYATAIPADPPIPAGMNAGWYTIDIYFKQLRGVLNMLASTNSNISKSENNNIFDANNLIVIDGTNPVINSKTSFTYNGSSTYQYNYIIKGETNNVLRFYCKSENSTGSDVINVYASVTDPNINPNATIITISVDEYELNNTRTQFDLPMVYPYYLISFKCDVGLIRSNPLIVNNISLQVLDTDLEYYPADAGPSNVLKDKKFISGTGINTGTMANIGSLTKTISPSTSSQTFTYARGYTAGGTITVNAATPKSNLIYAEPIEITNNATLMTSSVCDSSSSVLNKSIIVEFKNINEIYIQGSTNNSTFTTINSTTAGNSAWNYIVVENTKYQYIRIRYRGFANTNLGTIVWAVYQANL